MKEAMVEALIVEETGIMEAMMAMEEATIITNQDPVQLTMERKRGVQHNLKDITADLMVVVTMEEITTEGTTMKEITMEEIKMEEITMEVITMEEIKMEETIMEETTTEETRMEETRMVEIAMEDFIQATLTMGIVFETVNALAH